MTKTMRHLRAAAAWFVFAVIIASLGFAAGRTTLVPPTANTTASPPAVADVTQATVGRYLPLSVTASWERRTVVIPALHGVLTESFVDDGELRQAGDVVISVDLQPVIIAEGGVPSFRDLVPGHHGPDVRQLQRLLADQGFLRQGTYRAGTYDSPTTAAVRAWQKDLDVPVTGTVAAQAIVYTTDLPARVVLHKDVVVGTTITADTPVLDVLAPAPQVTAYVTNGSPLAVGATVEVLLGESWQNTVITDMAAHPTDPDASLAHLGLPQSDAPLCGKGCEISPSEQGSALQGRVVIVPEVSGPTIPAAALLTAPEGSTYVLDSTGQRIDVIVQAHGDGQVVVDGLGDTTTVQLPEGHDR